MVITKNISLRDFENNTHTIIIHLDKTRRSDICQGDKLRSLILEHKHENSNVYPTSFTFNTQNKVSINLCEKAFYEVEYALTQGRTFYHDDNNKKSVSEQVRLERFKQCKLIS